MVLMKGLKCNKWEEFIIKKKLIFKKNKKERSLWLKKVKQVEVYILYINFILEFKSSRKVLTVDKRLKKDKRAMKAKARIGKGKKRRQVSRRKGKK